ncbi:PepSY domain-containing protein [Paraglaciecola sp. L3A3]|uniref:PepSY-associated TM helix domain-containing protein n=1 Tax=Paraglaciecola sp. L3A3 TaxID=2686358 RepID=UPI00131D7C3F|nr:PepSY domain-containing protein [Paraglaciecola sp. L3A3]
MSFKSEKFHHAVHRWHFFAGLFVLPFLFLLSVSGLLMLITKPIEPWLDRDLFEVSSPITQQITQQGQTVSPSKMLAKVQTLNPDGKVKLYIAPKKVTESARFSVVAGSHSAHGGHGQPSTTVFVNPNNGEVLGSVDPAQSLYAQIKTFHGSLFLGDLGDALIEIAAGLAVLMIISGFYMAWPKARWRVLKARQESWRRLHRMMGLVVGLPLLLFLLSGLAWTNFWGGQLVQPWGSLPGTSFTAPKAEDTHQTMNQTGEHQVPWAMEHTHMPMSAEKHHQHTAVKETGELDLNSTIAKAKQLGFDNFRVHLPQSETAVWTISATTIAGDITNPLAERTVHLDRFSGEVLADLPFADYPKLGQAMATFVPFHQGDLGWWNWWLNIVLVLMVIGILFSGIFSWWKRRPKKSKRLAAPAAQPSASKLVIALMLLMALCFPLSALVLAAMILVDWLVLSRINSWQKWLK